MANKISQSQIDQQDKMARRIVEWRFNPYKFAVEALGMKPTMQQTKAFDALGKLYKIKHKAHAKEALSKDEQEWALKKGVSIKSGQGCGKDTTASVAILHFLVCFSWPKILATANTQDQLKDVLWAEIAKWIRKSNDVCGDGERSFISSNLEWQAQSVFMKGVGAARGIKDGSEWFASARTCSVKASGESQAQTLAGRHEDNQLFVLDEASGIPDPVFVPLTGTLTGKCNVALIIFNPTKTGGYAAKTHIDPEERKLWVQLTWNAEESEIVSKDHIESQKIRFGGTDTDAYRVWVKGEFPRNSTDCVIPFEWVMDAVNREIEPSEHDPVKVGVDIGCGGDESVICRRHGMKMFPVKVSDSPDSSVVERWIAKECSDLESSASKESGDVDAVFIDKGGPGWGPYCNVKKILTGMQVYGVNFGEASSDNRQFALKRDEMWWKMREAFREGAISIPNDELLISELTSVKYETNEKLIKLESKRHMKSRGVRSPDRADALALTFYIDDVVHKENKRMYKDRYEDYDEDDYFLEGSKNSWMAA